MRSHWKILAWLVAGAVVGAGFQLFLEAWPTASVRVVDDPAGVRVVAAPDESLLVPGDVVVGVVARRGTPQELRTVVTDPASYQAALRPLAQGDLVWHETVDGRLMPLALIIDPTSPRSKWLQPFNLAAEIFLRLLKMLIVPLILTSIITGVASLGGGAEFKRLGLKTLGYYAATSFLAAITGLAFVNMVGPGFGAQLGLPADPSFTTVAETGVGDIILRLVPENIFAAFSSNINMLQTIFFALLFGFFMLQVPAEHRESLQRLFEAAFAVIMKIADFVLALIPYGVFALLVRVVGTTGFGVFKPLGIFMLTVTLALFTHFLITLPLILHFVARVRPSRWFRAMSPAIITAFSTSSSALTLPVSMETVEKRGKISNKIVSFVQPLGATINMDGTALYEGIGVIFLAQYYSSLSGFELTLGTQVFVLLMALLASVGAAGIPSAGLILMVTILSALRLPVEGAALLLAVDRPLDMMRTVINVFSDTTGSAVVARMEGEVPEGSRDG